MENRIEALVANYEMYRAQAEEADQAAKEAKALRDAAEREVINAMLQMAEDAGADDMTVTVGMFKYSASTKDYYAIPKDERDEAYELLRELGHGDLIVEKVDDRTLTKEMTGVKESNGDEFPAEYEPLLALMSRYTKPSLSRRKV